MFGPDDEIPIGYVPAVMPDRYRHPHVARALDTGDDRAIAAALRDVAEGLVLTGGPTVRADVAPLPLLRAAEGDEG